MPNYITLGAVDQLPSRRIILNTGAISYQLKKDLQKHYNFTKNGLFHGYFSKIFLKSYL